MESGREMGAGDASVYGLRSGGIIPLIKIQKTVGEFGWRRKKYTWLFNVEPRSPEGRE